MMSEDGRLWGGTAWSRREPTPDPAIRSLERLDASSLSERVYAQLRAALMRGELVPEQRLKIGEVAERLGTSATPVREAVFQLVREGALEIHPPHYVRVDRKSQVWGQSVSARVDHVVTRIPKK